VNYERNKKDARFLKHSVYIMLTANFATLVRVVTAVVVIVAEVSFRDASRWVRTFAVTRTTFDVC